MYISVIRNAVYIVSIRRVIRGAYNMCILVYNMCITNEYTRVILYCITVFFHSVNTWPLVRSVEVVSVLGEVATLSVTPLAQTTRFNLCHTLSIIYGGSEIRWTVLISASSYNGGTGTTSDLPHTLVATGTLQHRVRNPFY